MPRVVTKARQLRINRSAELGRQVTIEEVATNGHRRAALSRIENQRNERIDFDTIKKLCTFYGVPVGELLMIEENSEEI